MMSDVLVKKFSSSRAEKLATNMDTVISFNDTNLDDLDEKDAGDLLLINLDIRKQDSQHATKMLNHKNQLNSILKHDEHPTEKKVLSKSIIELLGAGTPKPETQKDGVVREVNIQIPDVEYDIVLLDPVVPNVENPNEIILERRNEDDYEIELMEVKQRKIREREMSVMSIPPPPDELDLDSDFSEMSLPPPPSALDFESPKPALPQGLKHFLNQDPSKLESFSDIPFINSFRTLPEGDGAD
jgi:hypothetical protein